MDGKGLGMKRFSNNHKLKQVLAIVGIVFLILGGLGAMTGESPKPAKPVTLSSQAGHEPAGPVTSASVSTVESIKESRMEPVSSVTESRKEGAESKPGEDLVSHPGKEPMTVHFLDVGQGQATLLKEGNYEILIDGGGRKASQFVVAYLKKLGIRDIDLMIATHFDEDHIAGLIGVMNVFPVKKVLCGTKPKSTRICDSFVKTVSRREIPAATPLQGGRVRVGDMILEILGPSYYGHATHNDDSIVSKIRFGKTSFLVGGDTEANAEQALLNQDLKADVMLANHHGSKGSNSISWLKKVAPAYVVISCGLNNHYGHPGATVLSRVQQVGAKLYRTDRQGTILFRSDGKTVTVLTAPGQQKKEFKQAAKKAATPQSLKPAPAAPVDRSVESSPSNAKPAPQPGHEEKNHYVLNLKSGKIHLPGCSSVAKMKKANRSDVYTSLTRLNQAGNQPCKRCLP